MPARIVFVNRFFWPDQSATSQILSDVAFDLAAHGDTVTVVTSAASYDDARIRFLAHERVRGVEIVRVRSASGRQGSLLARALAFLSFYVMASLACLRHVRCGDVLVVKTDPPLLSVPMMAVARLRGAWLVTWLQDLYPEVAAELDVAVARGLPGRLLRALRNRSLRAAAVNVAIGERMRLLLKHAGIVPARIAVIPNWTADDAIVPDAPGFQALRMEWGFSPLDIVVGYSGNLGRAHDIDTLLAAAQLLQAAGRNNIRFLFVGGGQLRRQLLDQAAALGLTNIVCRPYVDREQLGQSLAVADIHWLSLRPELEGLIVPSKVYGIAASGRAAIFVGSLDGEIAQMLDRDRSGLTCPIGDAALLARHIVHLADTPAARHEMGANGRAALDTHYNKTTQMLAWRRLIDSVATHGRARIDDTSATPAFSKR